MLLSIPLSVPGSIPFSKKKQVAATSRARVILLGPDGNASTAPSGSRCQFGVDTMGGTPFPFSDTRLVTSPGGEKALLHERT